MNVVTRSIPWAAAIIFVSNSDNKYRHFNYKVPYFISGRNILATHIKNYSVICTKLNGIHIFQKMYECNHALSLGYYLTNKDEHQSIHSVIQLHNYSFLPYHIIYQRQRQKHTLTSDDQWSSAVNAQGITKWDTFPRRGHSTWKQWFTNITSHRNRNDPEWNYELRLYKTWVTNHRNWYAAKIAWRTGTLADDVADSLSSCLIVSFKEGATSGNKSTTKGLLKTAPYSLEMARKAEAAAEETCPGIQERESWVE